MRKPASPTPTPIPHLPSRLTLTALSVYISVSASLHLDQQRRQPVSTSAHTPVVPHRRGAFVRNDPHQQASAEAPALAGPYNSIAVLLSERIRFSTFTSPYQQAVCLLPSSCARILTRICIEFDNILQFECKNCKKKKKNVFII